MVAMGSHVVVVLSFRGRDDTLACLESLLSDPHDYSVLVVDNGSFDGVLEEAARRHPDVSTLQTGRNLGFAGGMNAGLRWAMGRGATTITVLNNDTICTPDAVQALERYAADGAIVSPQVDYLAPPGRIWFAGGVVDADTSLPRHLAESELDAMPEGTCSPTGTLAGCCLTARADVWRRVGLFDERYFLLFEDAELSLRANRLGVPLLVCRQVRILHRVSASFTGDFSYLGLYFYARNGLLFARASGAGARVKARFLRRHVVPVLGRDVRDRNPARLGRHGVALAAALVDYSTGRLGEAPSWLQSRARAWGWVATTPAAVASGSAGQSSPA